MDCLTDFIGIMGCSTGEPESGLFINSLPGVTLESIAKIAKPEQATYLNVWKDVQARGIKKFMQRLNTEFQHKYKIKTLIQSIDLLKYIDQVDNQTAPGTNWRGFTIELTWKNTLRIVASAFQAITIQSLNLFLKTDATGDISIKVFDIDSGEVLDTFTLTGGKAGWNKIKVNKIYNHYRLFVAYNATAVESPYQDITNQTFSWLGGFMDAIYGSSFYNARIRGANSEALSANLTDNDLMFAQNTFGLSGVFGVGCEYTSLICNNRQTFATALFYLLGAELMIERIYSERLNRYTTIDKKQAEELRDYFLSEFENELKNVVGGISLDTSDACLECNQQIEIIESTL